MKFFSLFTYKSNILYRDDFSLQSLFTAEIQELLTEIFRWNLQIIYHLFDKRRFNFV